MPSNIKKIFYFLYALSLQKIILGFCNKKVGGVKLTEVTIGRGISSGIKLNIYSEGYDDILNGNYEQFLINEIINCKKFLHSDIFDIGAHFGYFGLCLAKHKKEYGHIHSFEPNPNNLVMFKKNLSLNPKLAERIHLWEYGVSDVNGDSAFNISKSMIDSTTMGGFLEETKPPLDHNVYMDFISIKIETITIDSFVKKNNVNPGIIKIDVEGAEYKVLCGAMNYIEQIKPTLFIEIHGVSQMYYVSKLLFDFGYRINIINENEAKSYNCYLMAYC